MLDWLHELPVLAGAAVVCAAFVVPTLVGTLLLQPYVARLFRGERDINTVLGFLLNAFALYFGVLLALLSIAVFENYNKAEDAVEREAASLIKLYRDVAGHPESARGPLSVTLHRYVDEAKGPGWAWQARGEASPAEIAIVNELHRQLAGFAPANAGESLLHAQTLRTFDDFVESRRLRIAAGDSSVPKIMWVIVLLGAAMNVVVIWMFDLSRTTHAIVGGALSLFIGLVIYMIAVLDVPFRGTHGIAPDALAAVHAQSGMRK